MPNDHLLLRDVSFWSFRAINDGLTICNSFAMFGSLTAWSISLKNGSLAFTSQGSLKSRSRFFVDSGLIYSL